MKKLIPTFIAAAYSLPLLATPVLQMNKAFTALSELLPYATNEAEFIKKENEPVIKKELMEMKEAFRTARHDQVIKHDLFAPSYSLIAPNVSGAVEAFQSGRKEYARWMLRETMSLCLDCHTRIPEAHASSFQNGELAINRSKFKSPYDLGVAQLIVRRYVDAKESFTREIQDALIRENTSKIILPFQQILLIEAKVYKNPDTMITFIDSYLGKKLPPEVSEELKTWKKRLVVWKNEKTLTEGISTDKDMEAFIKRRLAPMKFDSWDDSWKVDLLFGSGVLSNYFFENMESKLAPELSYWIGFIEKRLKKEEFFSSGDLFLKQCILKYPQGPVAKDCLKEYKESVEFDFSGSRGTDIPKEVQEELNTLQKLVRQKGKK